METQTEKQPLDYNLGNREGKKAELIPFEIVQEEEKQFVITPARWQLAVISVIGILAIIGIAIAGISLVICGLLIAIPLIILRGILAPLFRK